MPMGFMKKKGTQFFDEEKCEKNGLFVESLYIKFSKAKNDPSKSIPKSEMVKLMLEKHNEQKLGSHTHNDQQFIILATEFNILEEFLREYI